MATGSQSNHNPALLILGRFGEGSGNNTTANRIRQYLLEAGYHCHLQESDNHTSITSFNRFLVDNNIRGVFGVHALHAGKLLRGISVPYCLIFAGTDVNEYSRDESSKAIISEAVDQACILVAFSKTMAKKAVLLWPHLTKKTIFVIPQGVKTEPSIVDDCLGWMSRLGLPKEGKLFVLVAGLRPVKDPLYLVSAFSRWHQIKQSSAHLILVGPQLDLTYSAHVLQVITGQPGVTYLDALSLVDTHRLIALSFALVNSSLSEGMSTAILEAMDLGVPVIARDIPGNAAIVENGLTGLLYNTPEEFIECCESLLNNVKLRDLISSQARLNVRNHHSVEREKQLYCDMAHKLLSNNNIGCSSACDHI